MVKMAIFARFSIDEAERVKRAGGIIRGGRVLSQGGPWVIYIYIYIIVHFCSIFDHFRPFLYHFRPFFSLLLTQKPHKTPFLALFTPNSGSLTPPGSHALAVTRAIGDSAFKPLQGGGTVIAEPEIAVLELNMER
jgi:hypothetical protein